ncbi:MAG: nitronate monooxygenase [Candidatus Calescibacterium sp.]|nr:nitronate monooxygenase [Candidatus Calescibacterium sp.]
MQVHESRVKTALTEMLNISYPIIMAPMFLVSNAKMVIQACENGIAGCFPALNYRTDKELRKALDEIKTSTKNAFGVNIITNKSNIRLKENLYACLDYEVPFIITSLGSPEIVIKEGHRKGIKVFCDVIDIDYAKKVERLGADALIAVNNLAGGHAGNLPPEVLIPLLVKNCSIPVISAGGAGDGKSIKKMLDLGACGVSIGTIFIASVEAPVTQEYKQACVDYGKDDIVLTTKLSGTPCTVINTPYVQKIGTKQNWLERILNKNKRLKKYVKMLTFYKGMKMLERAAFSATYQTMWCAGPSIEYVKAIRPIKEIVEDLTQGLIIELQKNNADDSK